MFIWGLAACEGRLLECLRICLCLACLQIGLLPLCSEREGRGQPPFSTRAMYYGVNSAPDDMGWTWHSEWYSESIIVLLYGWDIWTNARVLLWYHNIIISVSQQYHIPSTYTLHIDCKHIVCVSMFISSMVRAVRILWCAILVISDSIVWW